jgi:acetyl-CoA C-acetyltransferase
VDLLGEAVRQLVERSGIEPGDVDDVIVGSVLQWGVQHGNVARNVVLAAGLPESVPGVSVDRQCGSGQQAVSFAAQGVAAGAYDLVIAGGVESMSQAPTPPSFVPGAPLGPQYSPRMLARYPELMPQGRSSELMNQRFHLTREAFDAYSVRSHERAAAAWQAGRFAGQLVRLNEDPSDLESPLVAADEGVRAHPNREKMATLKPVFGSDGLTTAANASQISDGAAALLIASRAYAERRGLKPRARFVVATAAAADPVIQFTAVLDATHKALKKAGLSVADIDLLEVNEAFAGVPLMFQQ